ncbi:MAG TPA: hypothetical protein VFD01_03590 [Candidatus Dormibacteraeota bacterium]|jgi:hypothetical protein|nr:hypothetical protein [Candidatus Dormibacteraeota bacterium]
MTREGEVEQNHRERGRLRALIACLDHDRRRGRVNERGTVAGVLGPLAC